MSPLLRALPLFSAAYAVLYVIAMYFNIAMFVYYPAPAEWHWHDTPGVQGPAMYWYGWIAYAVIGAATVAGLGALLPAKLRRASATGAWLVPLASMLAVLFIIRSWFIH
ncbi:MAG TPA: hypothetical protein VGP48_08930 [Stellaceae bacterium]|jgi:hypothetical protein|nr:hypothetical protein [Stellaceae bacterium]